MPYPSRKLEDYEAWQEYQKAGGQLSFDEWLDAGMPTIVEERAALAWLGRADAWLNAQVELGEDKGGISEAEYDIAMQDLMARLSGTGKYIGDRQTILDLPQSILNDVENYTKGLVTTGQKNQEQAQKEQQEINEAVLAQRAKLPLNVGGNVQQQVKAGYDAIRNLKLQLETPNLPETLKGTMQSQILTLEQAINQLNQSARAKARAQTVPEEQEFPREGFPEPGSFAQGFAEKWGMSPKAAEQTGYRYYQDPQSEEFANLTDEEKSGLTWVGIEAAGGGGGGGGGGDTGESTWPKPRPTPFQPPRFEDIGATGSPSWKSWLAQRYPSIVSQFWAKPTGERVAETWSTFLESERKRISEEFSKQSPYARGERPGAFAPKIKTVSW